jgi:uncharacterized protein DUF5947
VTGPANPLEVLARIRQAAAPAPAAAGGARCELCAVAIGDGHPHVVDVERRALLCACRPCWLVLGADGAGGGHFRAVPERYVGVDGFALSPAQWEALQIPVGVAFFFHNSVLGRVAAFYPGPAGATESLLGMDAWDDVVRANPALGDVAADVEAVLVDAGEGRPRCFVVPIDACYRLVGLLRRTWRGFDGGEEVRAALAGFFATVEARAAPVGGARSGG